MKFIDHPPTVEFPSWAIKRWKAEGDGGFKTLLPVNQKGEHKSLVNFGDRWERDALQEWYDAGVLNWMDVALLTFKEFSRPAGMSKVGRVSKMLCWMVRGGVVPAWKKEAENYFFPWGPDRRLDGADYWGFVTQFLASYPSLNIKATRERIAQAQTMQAELGHRIEAQRAKILREIQAEEERLHQAQITAEQKVYERERKRQEARERALEHSRVYAVRLWPEEPRFKLGFSTNVAGRMASFSTIAPFAEVVALWRGGFDEEQALMERLDAYRIQSEVFCVENASIIKNAAQDCELEPVALEEVAA